MRLLALLDSCVIFPMPLCDTLMRAGEDDLYQMYYSQEILNGATRNLIKKRKMTAEKAQWFQSKIIDTFPEGLVEVPTELESLMTNHHGDRHVLAAAVYAKVDTIVTANIKHFRAADLKPWNVRAVTPDEFLCYLCDLHEESTLYRLLETQAEDLKHPPTSCLELIGRLEREQPQFTDRMLLYRYGKTIESIARSIKYIWEQSEGSSQIDEQKYRIDITEYSLTITEKSTGVEIFQVLNGAFKSNLKVENVNDFLKMNQVLGEASILGRSIVQIKS